jgi:hypothetical protein
MLDIARRVFWPFPHTFHRIFPVRRPASQGLPYPAARVRNCWLYDQNASSGSRTRREAPRRFRTASKIVRRGVAALAHLVESHWVADVGKLMHAKFEFLGRRRNSHVAGGTNGVVGSIPVGPVMKLVVVHFRHTCPFSCFRLVSYLTLTQAEGSVWSI